MPSELARQWFVPNEGIDRHVIVADIQRYLGNDATVRPGMGTGENEGVQGYWIKAYRNLTTAMISDLRADSQRWRQEQRMNGTSRAYVDSSTYRQSNAGATDTSRSRRDGNSPAVESGYGAPARDPRERAPIDRMAMDRMPMDRMPADRMPERMPDRMPMDSRRTVDRRAPDVAMMDIDPPAVPQDRRYTGDRNGYMPDPRQFASDPRGFANDNRSGYPARDPREQNPYARGAPPVSSSYVQDTMYASSGYAASPSGAPPGFVQQGGYYVPVSSYDPPAMTSRVEPSPYGANPYDQSPVQRHGARDGRDGRDTRDVRDPRDARDTRDPRDTRYAQDYQQDPRYAYPSPVPTVSSVNPRERESVTSPPQQRFADSRISSKSSGGVANKTSVYGTMPSYDQQYGGTRPGQFLPGQSEPKYGAAQSPRVDPNYGRERPAAPSSSEGREARRRRVN